MAPGAEVRRRPDLPPEQQLGERRQGDRRQRDGLGLLPRARTPDEHEYRARLNRLGGLVLSGFGALIAGGSGSLLALGSVRSGMSGVMLGAALLARGLYVIGRRERRRRGRRKVRSRAESMDLVRSSAPRRSRRGVVKGKE